MVSPSQRRQAADLIQTRLGLLQRRACQIVRQHRSTQRHRPKHPDPDEDLRATLRDFARHHHRWGYRRAHVRMVGFQKTSKLLTSWWDIGYDDVRHDAVRLSGPPNERDIIKRHGQVAGQAVDEPKACYGDGYEREAVTQGRGGV
jgi:hypothetical protein